MEPSSVVYAAYSAYQNRDRIKRLYIWLVVILTSLGLFLYLTVATVIAVVQGTGTVTDGAAEQSADFQEFQQFSYKTIYGEAWYQFVHPYQFPTLGLLTQGVILDSSAKVGTKHIAWDIADHVPRQTEIRAFADGTVVAVNDNILHNTTRRWRFCDDSNNGICWYEVTEPADVQIACGNEIIIQHADNLRTQYCHLQSAPSLKAGDSVVIGQVLGYQGSTGWATGKHLHFALWRDGLPIDPSYAFLQTSLSNWGE